MRWYVRFLRRSVKLEDQAHPEPARSMSDGRSATHKARQPDTETGPTRGEPDNRHTFEHCPRRLRAPGARVALEMLVGVVGIEAEAAVSFEKDHAIPSRQPRGGAAVVGDLAGGDQDPQGALTTPPGMVNSEE